MQMFKVVLTLFVTFSFNAFSAVIPDDTVAELKATDQYRFCRDDVSAAGQTFVKMHRDFVTFVDGKEYRHVNETFNPVLIDIQDAEDEAFWVVKYSFTYPDPKNGTTKGERKIYVETDDDNGFLCNIHDIGDAPQK
jgi:hypothetical protein